MLKKTTSFFRHHSLLAGWHNNYTDLNRQGVFFVGGISGAFVRGGIAGGDTITVRSFLFSYHRVRGRGEDSQQRTALKNAQNE